jgi:cell division protein FtsI/penicillin-binding protein 2
LNFLGQAPTLVKTVRRAGVAKQIKKLKIKKQIGKSATMATVQKSLAMHVQGVGHGATHFASLAGRFFRAGQRPSRAPSN